MKVRVIGHVDHGKTLSASLIEYSGKDTKQLTEIIKDEKSIEIIARPDLAEAFPKDGKAKRRERRKNKRKTNP